MSRDSLNIISITALLLLALIAGCAGQQPLPPVLKDDPQANGTQRAANRIVDPAGPIPRPSLPPGFAPASGTVQPVALRPNAADAPPPSGANQNAPATDTSPGIAYTVTCSLAGTSAAPVLSDGAAPSRSSGKVGKASGNAPSGTPGTSGDTSGLIPAFEGSSILHRLAGTQPKTMTGLEQRLNTALKEGRDVLHSQGYYAGTVQGTIQGPGQAPAGAKNSAAKSGGVVVAIVFTPGPQYRIGQTQVVSTVPTVPPVAPAAKPGSAPRPADAAPPLPVTLTDDALPAGSPAKAESVLAAVDRVRDAYRNNGYPFATVSGTRYVVDHHAQTLNAYVTITPGEFVLMGDIQQHGAATVNTAYLKALQTWKAGRPWSQNRVEAYRDSLRQSGLFQSIDIAPAKSADADGLRPVDVTLASAPERTIGGALKYHSDFGPGLYDYWENRNLTGAGDKLRFEMPLWADMQEATATYRRPFFFSNSQDFIAKGGFLHQDTDAYTLQSASASAGIERRFTRQWSGSIQGSAEGGFIQDPGKPRRDYQLFGVPLGLTYNTTNSLLDATQGVRALFSLAPYTGEYDGVFSIVRSRVDAQTFLSTGENDHLTLALRGAWGTVTGTTAAQIPPSVRFYSGGGGSVRGYEYQSIGPRNSNNDPLGGTSLMEAGAETRWKLTNEWGVVAFLDGGMVSDGAGDAIKQEIQWGTGLGIRYYTAIGPVRLDIATPLNPRKDDDPLQFYISIGQSF